MTSAKTKTERLTLEARTAADLMTDHVISIPESSTLHEAIALLIDRGFSGAPVINDAGRAVGVISQSDIVVHDRNTPAYAKAVPEFYQRADLRAQIGEDVSGFQVEAVDRTRVRDVMTPVVFSIRPDAPSRKVIEEMLNLRVHRLFVIDAEGVLVGVIAMSDILRRLID